MPQLESLLGRGSFDAGVGSTWFATLLGTDSRWAESLQGCWAALRAELTDNPGVLANSAWKKMRRTVPMGYATGYVDEPRPIQHDVDLSVALS